MPFSCPAKTILSGRGLDVIGSVAKELKRLIGSWQLQTYFSNPKASETVEKRNRVLTTNFAFVLAAKDSDWDEQAALACFDYSTRVCSATCTTPVKVVSELEAL